MLSLIKGIARDCLPPVAQRAAQYIRQPSDTGFWGNYPSFADAQSASAGYDAQLILDKALQATLKVAQGEAVAERDTVLFDEPLYVYPVFAHLLRLHLSLKRPIRVCDFGGALGSTYFQFKSFVDNVAQVVDWTVVEQPHFVACGKQAIKSEALHFAEYIEAIEKPDVILLSSVLQYLPNPYEQLQVFIDYKPQAIILDRTPYWLGVGERLTVQRVPKSIYEASYPCWLLDESKVQSILSEEYQCLYDAKGLEGVVTTRENRCCFRDKIYLRR